MSSTLIVTKSAYLFFAFLTIFMPPFYLDGERSLAAIDFLALVLFFIAACFLELYTLQRVICKDNGWVGSSL
ncbi:hypothetical protein F5X98DRAFT_222043 [Xylaria grammica]|nr:hypothetical protein F5X98DRAFT_222043 [Xylaria grammica]